jgi:hypothetical protein
MRISKLMAVAVSGCALAAAAAVPAVAGAGHAAPAAHPAVASKTKTFPSTLTPHTVKSGQTLTLRGHGAKKSTKYTCVLVVIKGSAYTINTSTKTVKSTAAGKVTCKMTYKPYKTVSLTGGAPRQCPLTKAEKKGHWRCGLAVSTLNKSSATIQYFTTKK